MATINPNILQEDWNDTTDWTVTQDDGTVVEISPAGVLHIDGSGATDTKSYGRTTQTISSWGTGDYWVEFYFAIDAMGGYNGGSGGMRVEFQGGTNQVVMDIANGHALGDGIIAFDGVQYNLVYSNTWDTGWHTLKFYIHNSQTDMDIYVDGDLEVSDADVNYATSANGRIQIIGKSDSLNDTGEYHMDYFYLGSEETPSGEGTPKSQAFITG